MNEETQATILLVEDDPLLAMDLEALLSHAGYRVVGPAASSAEALSILREETPDLAILDLNLHGEMAFPVFDYLEGTGAPFIVLSGHSQQVVPPRHALRPFLQKPCDAGALLRAVDNALRSDTDEVSLTAH